jgi:hypothetical protein
MTLEHSHDFLARKTRTYRCRKSDRPHQTPTQEEGHSIDLQAQLSLTQTVIEKKECENLRIQLEAMKNEVKKREELLAEERRLRLQQEQQLRARNPQDARTPEQAETREFVRQWAQGPPPPRQTGPAQAHNQTQSTTTGLINDFNKINIDPITTVLAQLGVKAQAQANTKPPERMHLKPAEEQHIKTITDMSAEKSQELTSTSWINCSFKAHKRCIEP